MPPLSNPNPNIGKAIYDRSGPLMVATTDLVKNYLAKEENNLPKLFIETKIPFYWLKKFARGEIPNPSVNRVEYLFEYLTKLPSTPTNTDKRG